MKIYCTGLVHSHGDFNGKPYDNYVFYFTDADQKEASGTVPFIIKGKIVTYKVKVIDWPELFPDYSPNDFIGKQVSLVKNMYDQISDMNIL